MTATRVPSEAELIELENWLNDLDGQRATNQKLVTELLRKNPEGWYWADAVQISCPRVEQLLARIRLLLDLARTVQNPEK